MLSKIFYSVLTKKLVFCKKKRQFNLYVEFSEQFKGNSAKKKNPIVRHENADIILYEIEDIKLITCRQILYIRFKLPAFSSDSNWIHSVQQINHSDENNHLQYSMRHEDRLFF